MSGLQLRAERLAGVEVVGSRAARRALLVFAFALATALSAYVVAPIPGTPVPVTLQTMVVVLSGVLLGPALGAAAQAAYLAAGMAGAPVFFGGAAGFAHLFGPTGGYLLAFPVAAALAGRVAGMPARGVTAAGVLRLVAALLLGFAVILAGGAAQLALITGDGGGALRLGVLPFLTGELLKSVVALLLALRLRNRTLGLV